MQQTITDFESYLQKCLEELKMLEAILARAGEINSLFSAIGKVVLIFLGALVTTKEVANQLLGATNGINIVIFTLAGLFVAVIAGLEAAFKWEKTATELKGLAGTCQKYIREGKYRLAKVHLMEFDEKRQEAIEALVDDVNKHLDDIYEKSTTLGINVVREITLNKSETT